MRTAINKQLIANFLQSYSQGKEMQYEFPGKIEREFHSQSDLTSNIETQPSERGYEGGVHKGE